MLCFTRIEYSLNSVRLAAFDFSFFFFIFNFLLFFFSSSNVIFNFVRTIIRNDTLTKTKSLHLLIHLLTRIYEFRTIFDDGLFVRRILSTVRIKLEIFSYLHRFDVIIINFKATILRQKVRTSHTPHTVSQALPLISTYENSKKKLFSAPFA